MSMAQASVGPHLEQSSPAIDFFCHICGGSELEQVCASGEVAAQIEYLRRFHRRRLRHPTESALKDRVTFTQEYLTDIVACRDCGLVCRSSRPSADAIAGAYSNDHYGQEHLSFEFILQCSWAESKVRSLAGRLQGRPSQFPFVVEVGSFVGGFLAAGRKRGWKMIGVEIGRASRREGER